MGNGFVLKALTKIFAVSARLAVNKIEPQRTLKTQRGLRNSISMGVLTEAFVFSAGLAVN